MGTEIDKSLVFGVDFRMWGCIAVVHFISVFSLQKLASGKLIGQSTTKKVILWLTSRSSCLARQLVHKHAHHSAHLFIVECCDKPVPTSGACRLPWLTSWFSCLNRKENVIRNCKEHLPFPIGSFQNEIHLTTHTFLWIIHIKNNKHAISEPISQKNRRKECLKVLFYGEGSLDVCLEEPLRCNFPLVPSFSWANWVSNKKPYSFMCFPP